MGRKDKRVQPANRADRKIPLIKKNFLLLIASGILTKAAWDILIPVLSPYLMMRTGSPAETGIIMGSAPVITLLFRRRLGRLILSKGSREFILYGTAANAAGTLLYPHMSGFLPLLTARMLQGSGLIIFFFASVTMVSRILPRSRRGELFAVYTTVFIFPLLFAPLAGSAIAETLSFQAVTRVSSLLLGAAFLLCLNISPVKTRAPLPAHPPGISKIPVKAVLAPYLLLFFIIFADAGIITFLPIAAQHYNIPGFSLFFTFFAVSTITARLILGRAFDRHSKRLFIGLGAGFSAAGILIISGMTLNFLIFASLVYGAGFAMADSNLLPYLMKKYESRSGGSPVTLYSVIFDTAYLTAPPVMGFFSLRFSYGMLFVICFFLVSASCAAFLLSPET